MLSHHCAAVAVLFSVDGYYFFSPFPYPFNFLGGQTLWVEKLQECTY